MFDMINVGPCRWRRVNRKRLGPNGATRPAPDGLCLWETARDLNLMKACVITTGVARVLNVSANMLPIPAPRYNGPSEEPVKHSSSERNTDNWAISQCSGAKYVPSLYDM